VPYEFRGVLYGFDDDRFVERDAARLQDLLQGFKHATARMFQWFRDGQGNPMRSLDETRIRFLDPGDRDPPITDGPTTHLLGYGACTSLCIYQGGWLECFRGEETRFVLTNTVYPPTRARPRRKSLWHIQLERQNGQIEDWARRRGMKG
jgi:hypothetical protein